MIGIDESEKGRSMELRNRHILETIIYRVDPLIRALLFEYENAQGSVSSDRFSYGRLSAAWSSGPVVIVLELYDGAVALAEQNCYFRLIFHTRRPGIQQLAAELSKQTCIPVRSIQDECPTPDDYLLANLD